jgi:hypothetical protein
VSNAFSARARAACDSGSRLAIADARPIDEPAGTYNRAIEKIAAPVFRAAVEQ